MITSMKKTIKVRSMSLMRDPALLDLIKIIKDMVENDPSIKNINIKIILENYPYLFDNWKSLDYNLRNLYCMDSIIEIFEREKEFDYISQYFDYTTITRINTGKISNATYKIK